MRSLVLALLLFSPAAGAEGTDVQIGFSYKLGKGAEDCPDAQAVQDAVAARLGYRPFAAHAQRRVVAKVESSQTGLVGSVRLYDGTKLAGEREVVSETKDCFELSKALELAISIAIDPMSVTRPAPPPSPDEEGPPPPPPERAPDEQGPRVVGPTTIVIQPRADRGPAPTALPPPSPDEEGPPPPPPRAPAAERDVARSTSDLSWPWSFHLYVGPTFVYGPTPRPSLGGTVGGGVRYRFFSLNLELRRDPPTANPVLGGAGAVVAERNIAQASACGHLAFVFGCGTAALGAQMVSGIGFVGTPPPFLSFFPYFSGGLRGGVDLPVFPWWPVLDLFYLRLFVDLDFPILTYEAVYGPGQNRVWKTERVNLGVGSALMVSFP